MANNNRNDVSGWVGWIYFAGFLMFVAGLFQLIAGFTALLNDTYFLVQDKGLVVFDYATWGWIHLVLGLIVMLAGMAVINGRVWGRVIAVFLSIFSILANFAFLSAYPIWSILAISVNVLVLYALTVHGSDMEILE